MLCKLRVLVFILLIVVCKAALAFDTINSQFSFFSYDEGVFDKDVFDFVEYDQHIWVHTSKHVYRLIGNSYVPITFSKEENKHQLWIPRFSIINDKLLALNRKGLFIYDKINDEFKSLHYNEGVIRAIGNVTDSLCVIATDNGVGLAMVLSDSIKGLAPLKEIQGAGAKMLKYSNGDLLVGTTNGLFQYRIVDERIIFKGRYLNNYAVEEATILSDGSIWVGTGRNGLFVRELKNQEFVKVEDYFGLKESISPFIRRIIERDNDVWVATFDGIYIFKPKKDEVKWLGKPSLNANSIFGLMFDSMDNIWVGGRSSGVNVSYNHNHVFEPDGRWQWKVRDIQVSTFCEDSEANYWAGTIGQPILYRYNSRTSLLEKYDKSYPEWTEILNAQVKTIYCDLNGEVWCGTDEKGLFKFNSDKQVFESVVSDSLFTINHSAIEWLQEDVKGNIIVGQYTHGVYRVEPNNNFKLTKILNLSVAGLCKDESGLVWILTPNKIYTWDGEKIEIYIDCAKYGRQISFAVNKNKIAVGLDEEGLLIINRQTKSINHLKNPFRDEYNNIVSIAIDKFSRLWLASLGGMSVYESKDSSFVNFKSNMFHGCGQYSGRVSFKDSNKRIWFGGEKGLQLINPEKYKKPSIEYLGLKQDDSFEYKQDSVFYYNNANMDFKILSSNYDKNLELRYELFLESVDTVWRACEHIIEIRNLEEGEYKLKTRATVDGRNYTYSKPVYFTVLQQERISTMYIVILILTIILIIAVVYIVYTGRNKTGFDVEDVKAEDLISKRFEIFNLTGNVSDSDALFLDKLLIVLKTNCTNPEFSVEYFENEMSLGHATFYRKLKSITDVSANNIIKKYRLDLSKNILIKSANVSETAYSVGFNDAKYFGRCFKQEYGITPKEYILKMPTNQD